VNDPIISRALTFYALTALTWSLGTYPLRELAAQEVGVRGTVKCLLQGRRDQPWPAANVVVVPVAPKGSDRATFTTETGYYQVRLLWNEIRQANLTLKYVGKSSDTAQTRFIGEEQYNHRSGVVFPTLTAGRPCDSIELGRPELALQMRDSIRAQQVPRVPEAERRSSALSVVGGAIRLLIAAAEFGPDSTTAETTLVDSQVATVQQIRVGRFLSYAHSALSQNLGFSVTPFRASDEAVFSNPSAFGAIAPPSPSIQVAYGRFLRGSTVVPLNDRTGLGAGVYWLRQREDRRGARNRHAFEEEFPVDEIEATLAGYRSLGRAMSVGLSVEYFHQSFDVPDSIKQDSVPGRVDTTLTFSRDTMKYHIHGVDLGLSLSVRPVRHFVLGVALGQVFGTPVWFSEGEKRSLRTLDVGVAYLNGRLNLGVDQRIAQAEGSGLGMGLNYVPFNHTVIVLGASTAHRTRMIGLRFRNFSYTFELSDAFKKLVEMGRIPTVITDRATHVVGGRFDL
jgi:hypothetical protein